MPLPNNDLLKRLSRNAAIAAFGAAKNCRMSRDYSHEIGQEVRSISGGYELDREGTLEMDGHTIVYAVGNAVLDSSCCGFWGCRFAVVPGFVVQWKYKRNQEGIAVSAVDPIADDQLIKRVTDLLKQMEGVTQVQFW